MPSCLHQLVLTAESVVSVDLRIIFKAKDMRLVPERLLTEVNRRSIKSTITMSPCNKKSQNSASMSNLDSFVVLVDKVAFIVVVILAEHLLETVNINIASKDDLASLDGLALLVAPQKGSVVVVVALDREVDCGALLAVLGAGDKVVASGGLVAFKTAD